MLLSVAKDLRSSLLPCFGWMGSPSLWVYFAGDQFPTLCHLLTPAGDWGSLLPRRPPVQAPP
jgi:hypothetical protein